MMTNRSDRGSAKPRGSQRFERDDVIREPACGLHQGQQPCGAARTGRTHGCTRPVLIIKQKLLRRRGRPHMMTQSGLTANVESFRRRQASESLRCPNRGGHEPSYGESGFARGPVRLTVAEKQTHLRTDRLDMGRKSGR